MPSTRPRSEAGAGERLVAAVRAFGLPLLGDSSVKLLPGALSADRFLLTVHTADFTARHWAHLERFPLDLGLPELELQRFLVEARSAGVLHFGCDADPGATILKLYAEFPDRLRTQWASARRSGTAITVYRAVKWRAAGEPAAAFSTYAALPGRSVTATSARILELLGPGKVAEFVTVLFHRAAGRIPAEARLFLDVDEEGTGRRSFDLMLYDAGFTLGALAPQIATVAEAFALSPAERQQLAALPPATTLGHISGGRGRDGAPFLTLYFAGGPLDP